MKHKLTALLLACSLALTLCACGGKETDDTQTDAASPSTDADSSAISNAETTGDLPTDRVYTADTGEIFQEDLAWVRFHDNIVEGGHIILADHSNGQFICWDLATGAGLKTEALYDSYTSFIGVEGDLVLLAVLEDITPGALEPGYYLYNLADGSLKPYNGQYVGWLHPDMDQYVYAYWGRCRDRGRFVSGRFSGGQFGILLKGADKMPYFAFLDTDMNELTEPIQMSDYIIDGDYIISDTGIRSLDGTLLNDGSFTDLNDAISGGRVANGVISAKDGSCYGYDGQLLFDGIDYFQAKLVGTN